MKIAFFEVSASDKKYFTKHLAEHELFFFAEPLTEKNVSQAKDYDIISVFIYSTLDRNVIKQLTNVRAIATRSTGFDHIDTACCQEKNIAVVNVPHYGENTVAEHTFALILALSRNVHKSYARGLKEDFSIQGLIGFDLKDKTLGVVGTGHIGLHVIRIAKGFGMHVIACDVNHDIFLSEILHFKYASLDEVLKQSDIVTLHVPLNGETRHLINKKNIRTMKQGSLIINTSRGGIVENEALIEALDRGTLSGAGLDVLEGEEHITEENQCLHEQCGHLKHRQAEQNRDLLSRDNVVFTPHIGFYSEEALRRILDTTIENIQGFAAGKIINSLSVPSKK
ncbi:MAG: hydroxyacid dehydrogenase [Candidatus Moranbacteria bacterium RIFCSPHIGHO2_12_FULL_54_9]|nr:MAG: hydroxyacid dehydrogenase [Candidatus Moranbacteria bacterium RIFCSPHIGHO2_01_FULL_54_31]OGI24743.1 MAG: hydroxyacid dehydrogenase [Candidatus Moranbacteria bacterium RIFCSPHIGHO2_12_FULL_54_9]